MKTMKDTVEVTSVVNGEPNRMKLVAPEMEMPEADEEMVAKLSAVGPQPSAGSHADS